MTHIVALPESSVTKPEALEIEKKNKDDKNDVAVTTSNITLSSETSNKDATYAKVGSVEGLLCFAVLFLLFLA